jgi:hypothetical protein
MFDRIILHFFKEFGKQERHMREGILGRRSIASIIRILLRHWPGSNDSMLCIALMAMEASTKELYVDIRGFDLILLAMVGYFASQLEVETQSMGMHRLSRVISRTKVRWLTIRTIGR